METKNRDPQQAHGEPAEAFTGKARFEARFEPTPPGRVSGASGSFEPPARTVWHTHPLGQTVIVTEGRGHVQSDDGERREIQAGNLVICPPNEKHWDCATPDSPMTPIAFQEALDGTPVRWREKTTEEECRGKRLRRPASDAAHPHQALARPQRGRAATRDPRRRPSGHEARRRRRGIHPRRPQGDLCEPVDAKDV